MIAYRKGDMVKVNPAPSIMGTVKDNLKYTQEHLSEKITSYSILTVIENSSADEEMIYVSFDGHEDSMFKDRFIKVESIKLPESLFEL